MENPLKRIMNWLRRSRPTQRTARMRSRTFRPQLEQLDERLVPSALSSAISIQRPSGFGNGTWTDRHLYTVNEATTRLVEVVDTSRFEPASSPGNVFAVIATVDPNSGGASVFLLAGSNPGTLWWWDSYGNWYNLGGSYSSISATRDGHVYAVTWNGGDVCYLDGYGNVTHLAAPSCSKGIGIAYGSASIAASVGRLGGSEVFAIGLDHAIYVNGSNTYGDWRRVDNSTLFAS